MKCSHCGSELSIDDKVCPFCGQVNEPAKPYTDTMNQYEGKLNEAAKKVEVTTSVVRNYTVFLIVAVIMTILNLVVVTMRVKAEDIIDKKEKREAKLNSAGYVKDIDSALEEGDYFLATHIYLHNNVVFSDDDYGHLYTISLVRDVKSIIENAIYLTDPNIIIQSLKDNDRLDSLAYNIMNYCEDYKTLSKDYVQNRTTELDKKQREQVNEAYTSCLKVYLKLTDDQIDALGTMSKAQIAVLIGRSLGIYE